MQPHDALYHYGVKGMKWGVRKDRKYESKSDRYKKRATALTKKGRDKKARKYRVKSDIAKAKGKAAYLDLARSKKIRVKAYNTAANKMNKTEIARINKKYEGKKLTGDVKKKYYKEYSDTFSKEMTKALHQEIGDSSNGAEVKVVWDAEGGHGLLGSVYYRDKPVKHSSDGLDAFFVPVKLDKNGLIVSIGDVEESVEHFVVDNNNDVIIHYGVKGMKWGVRRYEKRASNYQRRADDQRRSRDQVNRATDAAFRRKSDRQQRSSDSAAKTATAFRKKGFDKTATLFERKSAKRKASADRTRADNKDATDINNLIYEPGIKKRQRAADKASAKAKALQAKRDAKYGPDIDAKIAAGKARKAADKRAKKMAKLLNEPYRPDRNQYKRQKSSFEKVVKTLAIGAAGTAIGTAIKPTAEKGGKWVIKYVGGKIKDNPEDIFKKTMTITNGP